MVTLKDIENTFVDFNRTYPPSPLISPNKLWLFDYCIKPKLSKMDNIKVIYPIYLFGPHEDKKTKVIIVTNEEKFIYLTCNKLTDVEDLSQINIDLALDDNILAKNCNLDFSSNMNLIKNILSKKHII